MLLPEKLLDKFRRMKSTFPKVCAAAVIVSLAVLIFTNPVFADDTNQWDVQVTGMRVIAPPVNAGKMENGALMSPPGVAVEIQLTPPDGKIVSINQFASKLDSFTDDKGTDLLAVKSDNPFSKPGFGIMDNSKTTCATVDMQAAGLPAKGATALNISGKVVLEVATGTKQFTVENVEMKTNAEFSIGDLSVMISNVGTNRNAWMAKDYPYSVSFSSLHDLENISTLEFFDSQGNKIEARKSSWGGGGFLGYFVQYDVKQNMNRVKIVATCWQDLKTIEVPISVKASVGL